MEMHPAKLPSTINHQPSPPSTPLARQLLTELTPPAPPLRFDAFMGRALFDPAHGYYGSGQARIGRGGDFYTSVTATRMFGRVLADHFAAVWEQLGCPDDFTLVEQGANDATFAEDVLTALRERHPALHSTLTLRLIEPFPHLRDAQRRTLTDHAPHIFWHDNLADLLPFTGIHFTNEYVDALPVRVFQRRDAQWHEWHVTPASDNLTITLRPAADTTDLPDPATENQLTERRPAAVAWLTDLAPKLLRGQILIVDYGYPRAELDARTLGTLTGYHDHQQTDDPLAHIGEQDLTAHVDFTALAEAAAAAGLTARPLVDQYHFLVAAARPLLLELETRPDTPQRAVDLRGLKTLLHPEIMGTQFKYLTLER